MATIDPVILQLRADVDSYVSDIRQSTAAVEQSLGRQEVAVVRNSQTFVRSNAAAQQSMRNLGYQISDIGSQLSAGTSPFLVLAQQGPQVANALDGVGGVAGRIATFFSGPWGAALLAAGSVVGVLTGKLLEAKGAGEAAAQGYDAAAGGADRLKRILDGIASRNYDFQAVNEAQIANEGLAAKRDRLIQQIKGLRGRENEAFPSLKKELDDINAQISANQTIIRAAEVAKRNVERLAKLNATSEAPTPAAAATARASIGAAERGQRSLESSLKNLREQFDPLQAAADQFRTTMAQIAALEMDGLLSSADAALYRVGAARQQAEAVAKAAAVSLGAAPDGFNPDAIIASASERLDAEREVNQQLAQQQEENVRNLANLYEGLLMGGTKNVWDTFKQIGVRVIAQTLAQFTVTGGTGGGLFSALAKGIGAAFGGGTAPAGRASGGYVGPGQTVRVNEQRGGVELLRMGAQGGTVIPLGQVNQSAYRGGGGGGVATVRLELSGDIDARIQSVSAGVAVEVVRGAAPTIIDASARETTARLTRRKV